MQFAALIKPLCDRVSGARVIVVVVRFVMVRKQVVIEENGIERALFEQRLRLLDRFGYRKFVARKTLLKPGVTTLVVIE